MPTIAVRQVDAFTTRPFTGNPAAVVADAASLTPRQMQAIAREMNVSETVFVSPASDPAADLQIRWFTPTTEVDLCGHATIGCFHALAEDGRLGDLPEGGRRIRVQTRSGTLPVLVERAGSGGVRVWFGLPVPRIHPCRLDREALAELLGTRPQEFHPRLPFVEFYSYAVVPLRGLDSLNHLHPDPHGLSRLAQSTGIWGFCAVTPETVDPGSRMHMRFFAPSEGILEDPVTGSAQGPLGIYLWRNGIVQPEAGVIQYVGEQGDGLGRPGRVHVRITLQGEEVASVEVGGEAVTVLEGTLRVE